MVNKAQYEARWPTFALMVQTANYALCISCMSVLINHVIDEFHLLSTAQGLMTSMLQLGSLFAAISTPLLQGRIKKTTLTLIACGLQVFALILNGSAPNFSVLVFACIVLGMVSSFVENTANSSMVDLHQTGGAKYMGLLHGFYCIGAVLAPLLIQALLRLTNWRGVYYCVAGVALIVLAQYAYVTRRYRALFAGTANRESKLRLGTLKSFIAERKSLVVLFGLTFFSFGHNLLVTWFVRYMTVQHGSELLGAVGISLFWFFNAFSRIFGPRLPVPPMRMVASTSAAAAACIAIGVLSNHAVVMVVMVCINAIISGCCMTIFMHMAVSRAQGNTSMSMSVSLLFNKIGLMTGPLVAATVAAFSMQMSMLVACIGYAATFLAALLGLAMLKREGAAEK